MTANRPALPRIRLFRDDRLERLTLISPWAFGSIWLLALALTIYVGWGTAPIPAAIALVLGGLLIWSLFEYIMHRFLFHLKPASAFGQWLIFLVHGNHHAVPVDRHRNLMPPIVSCVISAAVWGLCVLLVGRAGTLLFLGFSIGYVSYDGVHYACHQFPMRWPVLRQLRRHHLRHHHARQEGNYAITAIFWDRVFGTEVPAKPRPAKTR